MLAAFRAWRGWPPWAASGHRVTPIIPADPATQTYSVRLRDPSRATLGLHGAEPTPLVVAFELSEKRKAIVADALAGASAIGYLTEHDRRPAPKRCATPARS